MRGRFQPTKEDICLGLWHTATDRLSLSFLRSAYCGFEIRDIKEIWHFSFRSYITKGSLVSGLLRCKFGVYIRYPGAIKRTECVNGNAGPYWTSHTRWQELALPGFWAVRVKSLCHYLRKALITAACDPWTLPLRQRWKCELWEDVWVLAVVTFSEDSLAFFQELLDAQAVGHLHYKWWIPLFVCFALIGNKGHKLYRFKLFRNRWCCLYVRVWARVSQQSRGGGQRTAFRHRILFPPCWVWVSLISADEWDSYRLAGPRSYWWCFWLKPTIPL